MFARFYKSVYTSILIYNNYSQLYMFLRAEPSALTIAARIDSILLPVDTHSFLNLPHRMSHAYKTMRHHFKQCCSH